MRPKSSGWKIIHTMATIPSIGSFCKGMHNTRKSNKGMENTRESNKGVFYILME
ncbi:hypothetical protein DPMN_025755 [Dreissena polymorpha]|uniref:Uncharacterized protein n=1 Tax=Dreissena polymorpha TaxID=45954 RepID=A0A9D4LTV1_DREPO|nr:hypothetical protein DPMN_025755 [Dreissena polymorpha]